MEWKVVKVEQKERKEATIVKFEKTGDEFIGKYVELVSYEKDGEENHFWKFTGAFDEDKDEEFIIFPSSVLNTKMGLIPLKTVIKIVYVGKKPSEKNPKFNYKDFEVYTADEE